ncbi:MAG: DUF3990 domain-containing protein [Planctomycetaceae bacterium]|jgi:hypothetical protein|nr:DUF3990 domain-containing protein [Planctomycetaceae bacterium]
MKVYHGSYLKIDKIDLNICEPHKDFGQGFYVTSIYTQAVKWANRIGRKHHTNGVVTEFTFFENAFTNKKYNVLRFYDYNETWLDFVVSNRDFNSPVPAHYYDIVEGPVADDQVTARIDVYLRGDIVKKDFLDELHYHEPTHQICFCTVKSLLMLEQADFRGITLIEEISKHIIEALIFELGLSETVAADCFYNSNVYALLTDISTKNYEKNWREIFENLKKEFQQK